MIGPVLEFSDLQKLSGFDRRADVERWAETNHIPVKPCRGGVWTTMTALNRSLGVLPANDDAGHYPPDVI
jgi:hypothetical protein